MQMGECTLFIILHVQHSGRIHEHRGMKYSNKGFILISFILQFSPKISEYLWAGISHQHTSGLAHIFSSLFTLPLSSLSFEHLSEIRVALCPSSSFLPQPATQQKHTWFVDLICARNRVDWDFTHCHMVDNLWIYIKYANKYSQYIACIDRLYKMHSVKYVLALRSSINITAMVTKIPPLF